MITMKLQNKLAIALGVAVLSSTASAAPSFDLRHEIKDSNATSDDKLSMRVVLNLVILSKSINLGKLI